MARRHAFFPLLLSLNILPASLAVAQGDSPVLEEVLVTASGSQVELTPAYAGGQVARGWRAGLLGNLDYLEAPFSATAYTEALIHGQQAESVGDVLENDPMVRTAKGFGNFQEVYIVRGDLHITINTNANASAQIDTDASAAVHAYAYTSRR